MWATAQRDGRPADYRWRPLFNAAKFGWRPLLKCRAVTLPRRATRWNVLGVLVNRSQLLVGQSSPYCEDMWRRYCCLALTSFFPIVDTCIYSCEDTSRQSCAMVRRWRIFMVALWNRAGHDAIIFLPCDFYISSSFFFIPRLFSAVGDWMSTILLHMMWP